MFLRARVPYPLCVFAMALATFTPASGAITIGSGPWIGTDSAGQSYSEEFQDWVHADCRAMDGAGAYVGGRYNHNDGYDDSRDLIAFYSRHEGDNYYFRVDLYDLALGAENGSLDIYVAIDCAFGRPVLDARLDRRAGRSVPSVGSLHLRLRRGLLPCL